MATAHAPEHFHRIPQQRRPGRLCPRHHPLFYQSGFSATRHGRGADRDLRCLAEFFRRQGRLPSEHQRRASGGADFAAVPVLDREQRQSRTRGSRCLRTGFQAVVLPLEYGPGSATAGLGRKERPARRPGCPDRTDDPRPPFRAVHP